VADAAHHQIARGRQVPDGCPKGKSLAFLVQQAFPEILRRNSRWHPPDPDVYLVHKIPAACGHATFHREPMGTEPAANKVRILIVDDDAESLELIWQWLALQ